MFSAGYFLTFLCVFFLGQGTAAPLDQLSLSVRPPSFSPGQTAAVIINCTFFKSRASAFLTLSSLSIVDPLSNDVFIAGIDVFSVPLQATAVGPDVSALGDMNGAIGGYLTVTWHQPKLDHGVLFKCVAEGVGTDGRAIRMNKTVPLDRNPVTTSYAPGPTAAPGQAAFTPVTSTGHMTIDELKKVIFYQSKVIAELQATCVTRAPTRAPVTSAPWTQAPWTQAPFTRPPVTNAPWTQAPWTQAPVTRPPVTNAPWTPVPWTPAPVTAAPITAAPVTAAPAIPQFTHTSSAYSGHHYLLSQSIPSNFSQGQQLCRNIGGYVAEINDVNEYNFVGGFLASTNSHDQVYIGISYNDYNKEFFLSNSGGKVTFTLWDQFTHQPHPEVGRNCVIMIPDNNLRMSSTVCQSTFRRRYLCEVP